MLRYRADIDGLRAIAVVSVVLFHARVEGFGGGFVGVDVFFVISGYLITALILAEVREGRFSIVSFYERRVRRIFPALFTVIMFSSVVSYFLFLPINFSDFGKSVVATAVFLSNILFWTEAGYFAGSAELKPLLHTWSLAIEEQFYIFFPIFIIFVDKFLKGRFVVFTVPVLLISFLISIWAVANAPDPGYYLTPSRAWELMIGCLLAMGVPRPTNVPPTLRNALSIAGLGMIAWSVWSFSSATDFPGANALLPGLGAAFIIYAGESGGSIVGRLLAVRPLVFIGLISYSLYLWHWPVFVFARYYAIRDLTAVEIVAVIAASILISIASWRFVEKPFRGKSGLFGRKSLFSLAGVTVASASVVALGIYATEGIPQRLDPTVVRLAVVAQDTFPERRRCSNRSPEDVRLGRLCRIGSDEGPPTFIVWGDSHAEVLLPAVSAAAARKGKAGFYATRAGCVPLLDVIQTRVYFGEICRKFGNEVLKLVERSKTIRDIVLIGRWASFVVGEPYGNEKGLATFIQDSESSEVSAKENKAVFERGLKRTISTFNELERKTYFVAPVPEVGWNVPSVLARFQMFDTSFEIKPTLAEYFDRQAIVLNTLKAEQERGDFDILYPHEILCSGRFCEIVMGDTLLYSDDDHLTVAGTRLLIGMFQTIFD